MQKRIRRNIDRLKAKVMLYTLKRTSKQYFLCNRGIGDTLIFFSLLAEYYDLHPSNEKVNIIIQNNHEVLAKEYCSYIGECTVIKKDIMEGMMYFAFADKLPANIKFILPKGAGEYLGYKQLSIWDLQCITLRIPYVSKIVYPRFQKSTGIINRLCQEGKLNKANTVIISPDAVSVNGSSLKMWEEVITYCLAKGYKVLLNSGNEKLFNISRIYCSIDELYKVSEYAGYFIGFRSGLCDLLSFSTSKMLVVYPTKNNGEEKKKYTFANMPTGSNVIEKYDYEVMSYLEEGEFMK